MNRERKQSDDELNSIRLDSSAPSITHFHLIMHKNPNAYLIERFWEQKFEISLSHCEVKKSDKRAANRITQIEMTPRIQNSMLTLKTPFRWKPSTVVESAQEEENLPFKSSSTRDDDETFYISLSSPSVGKTLKAHSARSCMCWWYFFSFLNNIFSYQKKTCAHINRALNYKKIQNLIGYFYCVSPLIFDDGIGVEIRK